MKDVTTIRIDTNLKHQAKILGINISQTVEGVLKSVVSNYSNNDVDMFALEKEINDTRQKITQLKTHELDLLSQKSIQEEKIKRSEQTEIKEAVKLGNALKRVKRVRR